MNIIEVKHLTKTYHKNNGEAFDAVKDIEFSVKAGEIFSFLGPNGAGKSTTIGMLTAQKVPTAGTIKIAGKDLNKHFTELKSKIGVVTQHNNLDRGLTAKENLLYHARYFGMSDKEANERAEFLLEKFGLKSWENDFVKSFSGGMVQRLKIARAIVHNPEILFLDEPTTGLDPQYREILWEQMLDLNKAGTTVFLTTHYMEEPERFSDRIAIYSKGEIKAIGTAQELKKFVPGHSIARVTGAILNESQVETLNNSSFIEKMEVSYKAIVLYLSDGEQSKFDLLTWLANEKISYDSLNISSATLDDVFIQSWIGALIVLPISLLFMREYIVVSMGFEQILGFIGVIFLASITSAALGLLVGTIVKPSQIAAMFPGFLMPIVFTGAIFFTWNSLTPTPIIQKLVLINPLVYINEALRLLMIPTAPSIPIVYTLLGIIGFTILMGAVGYKRFKKLIAE